jgi:Fe-S-cluster containining protein
MAEEKETINKKNLKKVNGLYIDPKIFTFKFKCKCTGECCHYGVYTDLKEHDQIMELKDRVMGLFDETQSKDVRKWFEPPEKDEDFESGVAVGTEVINSKCTFLDKDGLCTLQRLANLDGVDKWEYKPMYCILFPLTIYENTLTIDDEHIDRLKTCNIEPVVDTSIFEACKEELQYFFGEKDFQNLLKIKEQYLKALDSGENNGRK